MCIRDRNICFPTVHPHHPVQYRYIRSDSNIPELHGKWNCSEENYQRRYPVSYTHLDVYKRQAYNTLMMSGWEYFDVFSINCYDFDPTKDMDFAKNAGVDLPIMIGEYHCGALDRGLPATGLKGVTNQEERGVMWRHFVEKAAAHPYGVAAHWFQYNDQLSLIHI